MISGDRNQLRQVFFDAWRKHQNGDALEPLERIISNVIADHPEYHAMFKNQEKYLHQEFYPEQGESNPFLHMAMHISLMEQITTDRPSGIGERYQRLCQRTGNAHEAEHQLMECLGRILWEAQSGNRIPDEKAYLICIDALLN